jgi:hypothetical protein
MEEGGHLCVCVFFFCFLGGVSGAVLGGRSKKKRTHKKEMLGPFFSYIKFF